MKRSNPLLLLSFLLIGTFFANAQRAESERGIELYKKGSNAEAVAVLEKAAKHTETANDAETWNYLGLAYIKAEQNKKAIAALKKAVMIAPENADYRMSLSYASILSNKYDVAFDEADHAVKLKPDSASAYFLRGSALFRKQKYGESLTDVDKAISLQADYAPAYILKSNILLRQMSERIEGGASVDDQTETFGKALETLDAGVKNSKTGTTIAQLKEGRDSIEAFYNYFKRRSTGAKPNSEPPGPDTKPLKIIKKRPPGYTQEARRENISGRVSLAVLFGADGKVKNIIVLRGIGFGLDEAAIRVAKEIIFEPQTEAGKPVPVVKTVEYGFEIH